MDELILTVIVSTYNRSDLLMKNLKRMLKCRSSRVEFIIGDNASTDDTWEKIQPIEDSRVRKYHNDFNFNVYNMGLLTEYAKGKYSIFVNDRDYIEGKDIDQICKDLDKIDADFVAYEKTKYKKGYYHGKKAIKIFIDCRHPGTFAWRTKRYQSFMNYEQIRKLLIDDNIEKAAKLVNEKILFHMQSVYESGKYLVHQPKNREKIPKLRKEPFKEAYISSQYRIREFCIYVDIIKSHKKEKRCRDILLAKFENSQRTVTYEFYYSLKKEGFAKRNNCGELKASDWAKNGYFFLKETLKYDIVRKYALECIVITVYCYWKTMCYIFKRAICG